MQEGHPSCIYYEAVLNYFRKSYYIVREFCLPFYALYCLFFSFLQLHSPLCAFKK